MSIPVTFNNTVYAVPTTGESNWGSTVTALLQDMAGNSVVAATPQTLTNKVILAQPGSVAAPAFSFAADTDTGLYQPAVGQLRLATNGVDRLNIDGSGNITVAGSLTAAALVGTLTNATITNPTLSGGTYSNPVITGGTITSAAISSGSITSAAISGGSIANAAWTNGTLTTPTITSPTLNGTISGNVTATGSINASTGLSNTQNGITQFMSTSAGAGFVSIGNSWKWYWDGATGNCYWQNSAGTNLEGWSGTSHWFCGDPFYSITASGSQRIFAFANTWYWNWAVSTGDLSWNQGGVGLGFMFRVSDGLSYSARGPGGGNGAYSNISDANVKTDIRSADHGLAHVCALLPKRFRRTTSATTDREEIGFVAQDVMKVLPEAVHDIGSEDQPLLAMQIDPIVAALVGAVKELSARVKELEAK